MYFTSRVWEFLLLNILSNSPVLNNLRLFQCTCISLIINDVEHFFMFICHLDILYCSIFILYYLSFWKTLYIFKTQVLWLWCVQPDVLPLLWLLQCGEHKLPLQGLHFHLLKNVFWLINILNTIQTTKHFTLWLALFMFHLRNPSLPQCDTPQFSSVIFMMMSFTFGCDLELNCVYEIKWGQASFFSTWFSNYSYHC